MPLTTPPDDEGPPDLDLAEYRPWVLQRGARAALMLHLRRFDVRSGMWMAWQVSYPHLIAAEYIGDKMLSLDFGARQFVIEGAGLDKVGRHLQNAAVLSLSEYSDAIWKSRDPALHISGIKQLTAATSGL